MLEGSVRVVNALGLHARAAAQLVKLAQGFNSRITIKRSDSNISADAKSILNLLMLAATDGTILQFSAEGADENEAFNAVKEIFAKGFSEI